MQNDIRCTGEMVLLYSLLQEDCTYLLKQWSMIPAFFFFLLWMFKIVCRSRVHRYYWTLLFCYIWKEFSTSKLGNYAKFAQSNPWICFSALVVQVHPYCNSIYGNLPSVNIIFQSPIESGNPLCSSQTSWLTATAKPVFCLSSRDD